MRKTLVSFLVAVLLLFAFTAGVMAETTASIVVTPETETFTISVPVAAGDKTVSGAQIYFKLSDNLKLENVELENVTKGFTIVKDDDTVGFFYMSTKTYSGDDGKYLITFKFSDDQPGEVIFTERKYVTDLGAGKVDTIKEQEYLKVTVHREEPTSSTPTSSAPSSQVTSSAPVSSNATSSQPSASSGTVSTPVSSNTVTSQPSASGTTSVPDRFEVQLPEQNRPASSEPATPSQVDPAGSEQPGTPSGSDPAGSDPAGSAPTGSAPTNPGDGEKPTSWWIVVVIIAVLAATGGGIWFWLRKKDPEED